MVPARATPHVAHFLIVIDAIIAKSNKLETLMFNIVFYALLLITPIASAEIAVEIPRSTQVELTDPATKRIYPVYIKVPRSYASNPDKAYPVIYLTDGLYTFQIASGATRFPMNSGAMDEAILVSISYAKGSKGASSRIRDYTPSEAEDWKLETGKAAEHAQFIRETVFPYMAQQYRVDPQQLTYVGNSLGGLFGAYLLFEQPDMFSSYVLGSPSVWFDNHKLLSMAMANLKRPVRVYLSVGALERPQYGEQQDMVDGATRLNDKLLNEGGDNVTVKFVTIDGAKHATAFPTTLIQGLDWLYGLPR